ncbi:hypothetical protein ACFV1N_39500 [Streptosporangium canum]|uniref:hypothetical protein n=1 Tax=Streptosporangium canum TaxID=324952 RepID=UPI0036BB8094
MSAVMLTTLTPVAAAETSLCGTGYTLKATIAVDKADGYRPVTPFGTMYVYYNPATQTKCAYTRVAAQYAKKRGISSSTTLLTSVQSQRMRLTSGRWDNYEVAYSSTVTSTSGPVYVHAPGICLDLLAFIHYSNGNSLINRTGFQHDTVCD